MAIKTYKDVERKKSLYDITEKKIPREVTTI